MDIELKQLEDQLFQQVSIEKGDPKLLIGVCAICQEPFYFTPLHRSCCEHIKLRVLEFITRKEAQRSLV